MDTIKKRLLIITLFLVGFTGNRAVGQAFLLSSVDGNETSIKLFFNDERDIITISCAKDTLTINGVTYIDTIIVLDKRFLLVNYNIRAGSGLHMRRSLIVTVKNNILCQALHITSLFSEEFIDFSKPVPSSNPISESSLFNVKFSINRNTASNYVLITHIHDEKKSIDSPKTNYERDNELTLNFDAIQNIFYSNYENLSQYFTIVDPKTQEETKQYLVGTFPMIQLGSDKYYYLKNEWYEQNEEGSLTKYSYR